MKPAIRNGIREQVQRSAARLEVHRLGQASKDGHPKHPLYLRDATELEVHT